MYTPTFNGSILKINRAIEHRNTLDQFKDGLFKIEENRPRLGIRYEPGTGQHVLYVSHMPDIEAAMDKAALIVGDVLNNLRSALDHLVYELVRWQTDDNVPNVRRPQFVIASSPERWDNQAWRLQDLHPNHIAVIKWFQPYIRRDERMSVGLYFHSLQMLADLNDTDKHRLIHVLAVPGTGIHRGTPEANDLFVKGNAFDKIASLLSGSGMDDPNYITRIELGTEIVRTVMPDTFSKDNVDVAGYVLPEIALADGRATIAVCDKITDYVADILRAFDPLT